MALSFGRTPDGRRLEVSRYVAAAPERAWEVLTDTHRWPEWGPSVRAVECEKRYVEEGTSGRVRTPLGVWVPFTVDTCRDRRWTWRVAGVPATGHRVESATGGCRVVFELPVLGAGYAPVCELALRRIATLV